MNMTVDKIVIELEQNDCSICPYKQKAYEALDRTKGYYYCSKYDVTIGNIYHKCDAEKIAEEIIKTKKEEEENV